MKKGATEMTKTKVLDSLITEETLDKIVSLVYDMVPDVFNYKQKDIVKALTNTNLSYATIARVVNKMLPSSKATRGSIAQMVRLIKSQGTIERELLDELRKDLFKGISKEKVNIDECYKFANS